MSWWQSLLNWILSLFGQKQAPRPQPVPVPVKPVPPVPAPKPVPTPLPVSSGSARLKGVDIYHGNSVSDWRLAAQNLAFVILKATEGLDFVDSTFASRWDAAKSVGILRGAYCFFHPGEDPVKQADLFLQTVGTLDLFTPESPNSLDLPYFLDWEVNDGVAAADDVRAMIAFIEEIENKTGIRPILYSDVSFFQEVAPPAAFQEYPLWVANYIPNAPHVPAPWKTWAFWQYSDGQYVPGMGNVDVDYFNGSKDDLKALCKSCKGA